MYTHMHVHAHRVAQPDVLLAPLYVLRAQQAVGEEQALDGALDI